MREREKQRDKVCVCVLKTLLLLFFSFNYLITSWPIFHHYLKRLNRLFLAFFREWQEGSRLLSLCPNTTTSYYLYYYRFGANFINILWAAFTLIGPKSAKKTVMSSSFIAPLGSAWVKAACRRLVKLTPGLIKDDGFKWLLWYSKTGTCRRLWNTPMSCCRKSLSL